MSKVKKSDAYEAESVATINRLSPTDVRSQEVQEGKGELAKDRFIPQGRVEGALYVGIDLGTSRTSISTSTGIRQTVLSCVGYCKDAIGRKRLGKDILVGQEALDNRLALDVVRPLKNGAIDASDPRCTTAVRDLLKHVLARIDTPADHAINAVIGAPARASIESQKAILQAVEPLVASSMIVSEPFAVAYGLDILTEALVIDIGAGTTDLCRMHGTLPDETDQITFFTGGDAIDERLEREILKLYPEVQLSRNMVRQLKEKYGFVSDPHEVCEVTLTEMGRPKKFDITDALRLACRSIVPDLIEAIYRLIGTFHPEFQAKLRNNVVLAGGGSRLIGLPLLIEKGLKGLGGGTVIAVEEPTYAGANGSLSMAIEMPTKYWKALIHPHA